MPKLKMPPTVGLRKMLEESLVIEAEIEMWIWYGYYIGFQDSLAEGWVVAGNGESYDIDIGLARHMRQAAIVRWEDLKRDKPEAIHIVEVDSVREALESRNET